MDLWFHRYALQNQRAKNCAVYVSTWNEHVAGYYAICTGGLEKEAAPGSVARGRPDPIPVIILARLAVDAGAQGKGVGRALLRDALARCFTAAAAVRAAAVVVHALDQSAKDFYLRHADFRELPGEPLHLLLPMKGIAQIVGP